MLSSEFVKQSVSFDGKYRIPLYLFLAFPTNERLRSYNPPPFVLPSFVKLDSLTRVDRADGGELKVLYSGKNLNEVELARIKGLL